MNVGDVHWLARVCFCSHLLRSHVPEAVKRLEHERPRRSVIGHERNGHPHRLPGLNMDTSNPTHAEQEFFVLPVGYSPSWLVLSHRFEFPLACWSILLQPVRISTPTARQKDSNVFAAPLPKILVSWKTPPQLSERTQLLCANWTQ